jgi:serine/threonine protein kinase
VIIVDGVCKIIDYGISLFPVLPDDRDYKYIKVYTAPYRPPEILMCEWSGYNREADVWAFGVLALEIKKGLVPFPFDNVETPFKNELSCFWSACAVIGTRGIPDIYESYNGFHYSKNSLPENSRLDVVIKRCLNWRYDGRPSMSDVVSALSQ